MRFLVSVIDSKSIFTAMKQNGPFKVEDEVVNLDKKITSQARIWVKQFYTDPVTVTKYRAVRSHVFDLLQIESFDEIPRLLLDKSLVDQHSKRTYLLLANLYGISGELSEIRARIRSYADSADEVINYLQNKVLSDYCSNIEISNEIETTNDPVDLLLIIFNKNYHKKARFEAKRKLVLMGLSASIGQREKETDIENKFSDFLGFLNKYVWSPNLKIGEIKTAYLFSRHSKEDFKCTDINVITKAEDDLPKRLGELEKLTLLKRRFFNFKNKDIPVYVSVRKKDAAAKIIKLLRKNEKNPAAAVDDELGLMAVLDSIADVKRFVRHLTTAAVKADSIMVLEDIRDTLTGGHYYGTSTGSSSQTQMLKFFARIGGMRVEFIIHTNETYLNYQYQHGIAHDEYEVRRFFDTGVADFLFPKDIYDLDMEKIRERQLTKFRASI